MSELTTKAANGVYANKSAIFWFLLFSINALCTSIGGALTGAQWNTLDAQSHLMIFIAVLGNWTGTIMAFFKSHQKTPPTLTISDDSNPRAFVASGK